MKEWLVQWQIVFDLGHLCFELDPALNKLVHLDAQLPAWLQVVVFAELYDVGEQGLLKCISIFLTHITTLLTLFLSFSLPPFPLPIFLLILFDLLLQQLLLLRLLLFLSQLLFLLFCLLQSLPLLLLSLPLLCFFPFPFLFQGLLSPQFFLPLALLFLLLFGNGFLA